MISNAVPFFLESLISCNGDGGAGGGTLSKVVRNRDGGREGGREGEREKREGGKREGERERVDLSKLSCPFLILRITSSSQSHSILRWYCQSRPIVGPLL